MSLAGQSGFSLLEVLIAAILLTCVGTATTALTLVSGHQIGAAARASLAQEVAASTLERLRSLPFASSFDGAPSAASIVQELFPHAIVARNQDDAFVSLSTAGGGATFTTRNAMQGVAVTTEATFVRSGRTGWLCVPSSAVEGYAADEAAVLPGDALSVKVSVQWVAGSSPHTYVLEAIVAGDSLVVRSDVVSPGD
jgi:Tfp pilus assembly protein PilV